MANVNDEVFSWDDAMGHDFSTTMKEDHRIWTEEDEAEHGGEDYERPYWFISNGCGPGNCSKKAFPSRALCWSFQSENNARFRYAKHLIVHGAHRYSKIDAYKLAFNQSLTHVAQATNNFQDREDARKVHANNNANADEGVELVPDNDGNDGFEDGGPSSSWESRKRNRPWTQPKRKSKWQKQKDEEDELQIQILGQIEKHGGVGKWNKKNKLKDALEKAQWAERESTKVFQSICKLMKPIPEIVRTLKSAIESLEEYEQTHGKW